MIKLLTLSLLTAFSINANAADFTVQFSPAPSSVTDASVNDVTMAKVTGLSAALPQIGAVEMYAGATIPTNWHKLDGASLLRTDYPELFAAIGTLYGAADSTHFSLPSALGIFVRNAGTSDIPQSNGFAYATNLGDRQTDQVQGFGLTISVGSTNSGGNPTTYPLGGTANSGGGGSSPGSIGLYQTWNISNSYDIGFGGLRRGPETRPVNISLHYIIRMK